MIVPFCYMKKRQSRGCSKAFNKTNGSGHIYHTKEYEFKHSKDFVWQQIDIMYKSSIGKTFYHFEKIQLPERILCMTRFLLFVVHAMLWLIHSLSWGIASQKMRLFTVSFFDKYQAKTLVNKIFWDIINSTCKLFFIVMLSMHLIWLKTTVNQSDHTHLWVE